MFSEIFSSLSLGPISGFVDTDGDQIDDWWFSGSGNQDVSDEAGNNVIRNTDTGSNGVVRRAQSVVPATGSTVKFEFKIEDINDRTYYRMLSGNPNNLFGLRTFNGKIETWIKTPSATKIDPIIDPVKSGTWYVAQFRLDDTNGFYLKVNERGNPSISGDITPETGHTTGLNWGFYQQVYIPGDVAFFDNYVEVIAS